MLFHDIGDLIDHHHLVLVDYAIIGIWKVASQVIVQPYLNPPLRRQTNHIIIDMSHALQFVDGPKALQRLMEDIEPFLRGHPSNLR